MRELENFEINFVSAGLSRVVATVALTSLTALIIYSMSKSLKDTNHNDIFYKFLGEQSQRCHALATELEKYKSTYGELPTS